MKVQVLTEKIQKNKFLFFSLCSAIVLFSGLGFKHLQLSGDYRYFFGKTNPQRLAFEKIQEIYSQDDSVIIAIAPGNQKVFTATTLKLLLELTKDSWQVPFSTRVDSLSNFQHSYALGDDILIEDLVTLEKIERGNLGALQNIALQEPLLVRRLLDDQAQVTGINIRVQLPGKSPLEVRKIASHVYQLVAKYQKKYPDHDFYLSGIAMLNNAFNEAGLQDLTTLSPIMYGVIILIMILLLRSFFAVLISVVILFFSVITAMGLAGWLGIPITSASAVAPTIILTVAIADSVHILKTLLEFLTQYPKKTAVAKAIEVNFQPVFLTSFTTMIGFLSLNFSDTPPFNDLGNITALGVVAAFFYSIILTPILTSWLPLKAKKYSASQNYLKTWGQQVIKHRYLVCGVTFLFIPLAIYFTSQIVLNDEFIAYFSKKVRFRQETDFITKNLTGVYTINFEVDSQKSQGIHHPDYLQTVEDFSTYLRTISGVTHVNTITDTFKRLNKNLHEDDPEYYRLPKKKELAAQYLLLYEMSLPYGLDLNNQINIDKSSTRVIVTLEDMKSAQMIAIAHQGEEWLKKNASTYHTFASSPSIMFSHITERNVRGMVWGTLLAFVLITLSLIFALKSLRYGLLSLIPNIVPSILSFGVWGLCVGQVGFAIAGVGSVTLGIIVDDTVHFISKYVRFRREKGYNNHQAILEVFTSVGPALVSTTIILVVGFGVLMLSDFKVNFVLGALSTLTIAIALLIDFTLLPACLAIFDGKRETKKNTK